MRIPPNSTTHSTTVSSWVASWRLIIVAAIALGSGMLPDLWPYLGFRLSAQSGPPAPVVENSIYKIESVPYTPRALNASAVTITTLDGAAVNLPFSIPFYGTRYSSVFMSNDGYIAFDPVSGLRMTDTLPRPDARPRQRALDVFHADMTGTVRYGWDGTAPNRVLTVDWSNQNYAYGPVFMVPMKFQAQLFENGAPPLLMYTNTMAPTSMIAARPLQGTAWVTIGADAGDGAAGGLQHTNFTQIFSSPYPAVPLGAAAMTNKGYALLETAGPTTTTELAMVDGTPLVGETAAVQATVTAGGLPVVGGGTVTFITSMGPMGSVAVDGQGQATLNFPFAVAQPYYFSAYFDSGVAPHYASSDASIWVTPAMAQATAIDFTIDGDPGTFPAGRPSTWVATVTSPGRSITDGSVRFTSDNVVRGTVPVIAGSAVLHATLTDGTHVIKAEYLPVNPLIVPSSITKTIDSGTSTVSIEPFVLENQWLIATVSGAGNVSAGSVAFSVDGVSAGEATITPLPAAGTANVTGIAVIPAPTMVYPPVVLSSYPPDFLVSSYSTTVRAEYSGSPTVVAGSTQRTLTLNKNATPAPTGTTPTATTTATGVTATSIAGNKYRLTSTTTGTSFNLTGGNSRTLFFVDNVPVGVAIANTSGVATIDVPNPGGTAHFVRAAFLGYMPPQPPQSPTPYWKPSSGTTTIGTFTKATTTTSFDLQVGTRLGQPVWTVNATVTTPSNATVSGGAVAVTDPTGVSALAPLVDGKATVTFVTPPITLNNATVLTALNVSYNGNDIYNPDIAPVRTVKGYPTQVTAVPVNASGGTVNPDYTLFDATVRMLTPENLLPEGTAGSLQVRDGQGGELLSDLSFDWVYQTTERLSSPHAVPLAMIAYSGQVWQGADGNYTAMMPSGVFLQHPNAQSRMTQLPSETPYEWINIPGGVPAFTTAPPQGIIVGSTTDAQGRCDDCHVRLPAGPESGAKIPWLVRFLSTDYPQVFVSSNGLLSFTAGVTAFEGRCPPIAGSRYGPLLAGFWADHDTRPTAFGNGPLQGGITTYQVIGQAPQRVAVFQWDSVNFYPADSDDGIPATIDDQASFQIHIYEDNRAPRVVIRNGPITQGGADSSSVSVPTIGVDYGDGVHADVLQCSSTPSKHYIKEAYQFQLALTNTKLTLEPSESPAFAGQPLSITASIDVGGPVANGVSTLVRTIVGSASAPVTLGGTVGATPNETIYTDTPPVSGNYSYVFSFNRSAGEPYGNASMSLVVPVVPAAQTRTTLAVTAPVVPIYGSALSLLSHTTNVANGLNATANAVRFTSGAATLGTVTSNTAGQAAFTTIAKGAGTNVYTATYAPGSQVSSTTTIGVSVSKRPLFVVPVSQFVSYGGPLNSSSFGFHPVVGIADSGLALNDSPATILGVTATTPRTLTSPVGVYSLTPTTPNQTNYSLTPGNSTVTVLPAGLTVIGPQVVKTFGAPLPPLPNVTYVGFVNNQTPAVVTTPPTATTAATQFSATGSYPIILSGGSAPNYAFGYVPGAINITPAGLTIAADSLSKTYGAPLPVLTATYTGFVANETPESLDVPPAISTIASNASPVGSYPITVTGGSDPNYTISRVNGTLTVDRATLHVAANNFAKVYGDPVPPLTSTFTSFVNGDTEASLDLPVIYTSSVSAISPVGGYSVTPSNAKDANYTVTFAPGNISVTARPLTLVVASQTRAYGTGNPVLIGTLTGAIAKDSIGASYTTTAVATSPVGDYPIDGTISDPLNKTANYAITITPGTLSVTRALLTVTAPTLTRQYGVNNPSLNASVTGLIAGDGITATVTATAVATSPIGTYPLTITLNDPLNRLGNYDVTTTNGQITVTQAALTLTTHNATRSYGAANPPFSGTITGALASDNISASYASIATPSSAIGNYPIIPSLQDPQGALTNYMVSAANGELTVTTAALQVTADNASRGYGQGNPAFTGTITGIQNGDAITATYGTTATATSNVGSYLITPTLVDPASVLGNYTLSLVTGTLTIDRATLSVTADDKARTYGVANPPLTGSVTGVQNADAITATFFSNTSPATPVGAYPILSSLNDPSSKLSNYLVTTTNGTLTIDRAALTITADDRTKVYGAIVPALTASYNGFVNGDTFAVLDTPVSLSTTGTAGSGVGSYPIKAIGAADHNYAITLVDGSLSVSAASLTITAENKAMTYGGSVTAFSATYSGFVNSDTFASLATPVSLTSDATSASSIGDYAIAAAGATSANYTIAFVNGTLSIGTATLTATADAKSRLYGGVNPAFTGTLVGVQNGDAITATYTSIATPASGIGIYAIVPALDDPSNKLGNYLVTLNNANLTIDKAAISVTTDNKSRTYGQANPDLTGTVNGVVNGDDITASYTTAATSASAVGGYAITPSLNDPTAKLTNYSVSLNGGTLAIEQATLTITADAQSKIYGATLPALTASYSGFVNGDSSASLDTPVTLATIGTASSAVGTYPITASGALDHNYAIAFVSGSLTVNPAALTIRAQDKSMTYGGAVPALTASYDGFVNGDDAADLVTPVSLSTAADESSPAGAYDIVVAAATSPNYDIAFVTGTLNVNRAALTITAQDQSKVYGAALPMLTAAYGGLVNGDAPANLDTQVVLSTTGTPSSVVGFYPISAAGAVDANYDITFVAGTLDVTRAGLTITATDQSKIYGAAVPALTAGYSGFVNGDDATALATPVSLSTIGTAASDVGTYPIIATAATSPNYDIAFVAGTLTVNRAALTITAEHKSKIYGASLPALTARYTGFVNGDDEWSLDMPVSLATSVTTASDVGTYAITATNAVAANYTITLVDGTFEVTTAALTITANGASKVYGAALPAFIASYQGFVNGDGVGSLDVQVAFTTPATAGSNTGAYAITPGAAADHNYSIAFVDGSLAVTPADLTITADNQGKVYGAALPVLTPSYSGFVNGDGPASLDQAPSLSTTGTASSSVGPYTITASGASDANYTIAYTAGTLTVTPAGLTITADNKAKVYGAANPALTASYSGFVNGDTPASLSPAVTLATTANAASAAGSYPITASAAVNPNYTITFVPGSLTVTKAVLTVKTNDVTKLLGAPLPAFTASYTGFLNGDTPALLGGALVFTTSATAASGPGVYTVTPSGLTSANYTLQFATGTMTITYNVCLKSDGTKPAGGTERILLQLCDASGAAAGPSNLTLTAMRIQTPAGAFIANPVGVGQSSDGLFKYGSIGQGQQGYIFHLRTQAMPSGAFDLVFSVSGDPQTHTARFSVR